MEAVITIYDKRDQALGTERGSPMTVGPGRIASFTVLMTNYDNTHVARISFVIPTPGIIDVSTDPGVSTEIRWDQILWPGQ